MESTAGKNFFSGKAYRLFVEELATHLTAAAASFSDDHICSATELRQLSSRFHTIKGGAGFFGLTDVQDLAGKLEDTLGVLSPSCLKTKPELCAIFEALKSISARLPTPAQ